MTYYVGILDVGPDGAWGVRIPDVPGCHGGGDTPEAAIADATSALRELAALHEANGIILRSPRQALEIVLDKDTEIDPEIGETLVMIPLILDRKRPVKANISLDAGTLEAIDDAAERSGLTRSAFLASAALDKIEAMEVRQGTKHGVPVGHAQVKRGRDAGSKERRVSRQTRKHR